MYTAISGIYENGSLVLSEKAPTLEKTKVVVLFLDAVEKSSKKGVRLGSLKNKGFNIPDNFNEPLEDLKDYQ